jgi:hypothetical protein
MSRLDVARVANPRHTSSAFYVGDLLLKNLLWLCDCGVCHLAGCPPALMGFHIGGNLSLVERRF